MDLSEAYQKLQEIDVNDLKRIGTAPTPVRMGALGVLAVAILAGIGWFFVTPAMDDLDQARQQEQDLREKFKVRQSKAAQLDAYKEQQKRLEESLAGKIDQLPTETELESLLVDLSQTSIAAGLTVNYFEPGNERMQEFYAEYPIELRVSGSYHEFGQFVSGLASLSRIVTLHNIEITGGDSSDDARNQRAGSPRLSMTLTAKTYRYVEEGSRSDGNGESG
jgi:type IV pilus assembly protein PilO